MLRCIGVVTIVPVRGERGELFQILPKSEMIGRIEKESTDSEIVVIVVQSTTEFFFDVAQAICIRLQVFTAFVVANVRYVEVFSPVYQQETKT